MTSAPKHFRVEQFLRDVERHELTVIRDEGLHRHLRFKRPGSYEPPERLRETTPEGQTA